ncbi:MAG: putative membrane-anchored protein conserved in bacteria [Rhodobacteraceae bacterium HLUCCA12]|nr:MAG: putative membrane-anchored protein conserved in bacteria [Rhodobacteraceae bacterium HLUCCA12]
MPPIADHPLRYSLTNELHARPAPLISVPGTAVFLALKPENDAAARDRADDRAHLLDLLNRHGAAHPPSEATHHGCALGRDTLTWENHTEFTSYTVFSPGETHAAFDPALFAVLPEDWLEAAPGLRMTSILLHIVPMPLGPDGQADTAAIAERLAAWFVPESLAVARVLDDAAIVASDFRIDPAGHVRMAVFAHPGAGPQRMGRIVQRLCEIETYRAMSMLGLARARHVSQDMGGLDRRLGALVADMAAGTPRPEQALAALMAVSAQLEQLEMSASFRFGATRAYEALVHARIAVLREARFEGRQTLAEFMQRRFDPAMRTVKAAESRLATLSERAMRAGRLLSTQVEVAHSGQNQALLKSMDRRADLQLRLQHTVEGLSVVAISYYAVGLAANLALPVAEPLGLGKAALMAALTPVVVGLVWLALRRIRRRLE